MVESYLRSTEGQGKALRESAGLIEAAPKVTGPGCSLFGYENQVETTRSLLEALRKTGGAETNTAAAASTSLVPNAFGFVTPGQNVKDWFDLSLLPSFDKVSKYFYLTVYGARATVDGLTFKLYIPVPPGLRGGKG